MPPHTHADTLHLAAWNLNHRTGRKAIPPAVIHAIAALDIDVLVLTEFVDGDHHARFKDSLRDIGFESLAVSVKAPRQNQVLIAARETLADDGLCHCPVTPKPPPPTGCTGACPHCTSKS